MVLDLGAGTFDVSLLQTSDGLIEVLERTTEKALGGGNVDMSLVEYCIEELSCFVVLFL